MSEFHGLHNPERHESEGWIALTCVDCEVSCYESMPCRCCLAAEVERLTDALANRDRRIAAALAVCEPIAGDHPDPDIAADYGPVVARDVIAILRGES